MSSSRASAALVGRSDFRKTAESMGCRRRGASGSAGSLGGNVGGGKKFDAGIRQLVVSGEKQAEGEVRVGTKLASAAEAAR